MICTASPVKEGRLSESVVCCVGSSVETVTDFIFLGSKITADGDCSHEIKRLLGRKAMTNLDSVLKSRDITLLTKVYLVKAMVFPVVRYGCQSWTIKKAECRRIGEGNGNPPQCSCLENPRDREPGGLRSVGPHRVGHDWSDLAAVRAVLCSRHLTRASCVFKTSGSHIKARKETLFFLKITFCVQK